MLAHPPRVDERIGPECGGDLPKSASDTGMAWPQATMGARSSIPARALGALAVEDGGPSKNASVKAMPRRAWPGRGLVMDDDLVAGLPQAQRDGRDRCRPLPRTSIRAMGVSLPDGASSHRYARGSMCNHEPGFVAVPVDGNGHGPAGGARLHGLAAPGEGLRRRDGERFPEMPAGAARQRVGDLAHDVPVALVGIVALADGEQHVREEPSVGREAHAAAEPAFQVDEPVVVAPDDGLRGVEEVAERTLAFLRVVTSK